jgi:hypothetical protein
VDVVAAACRGETSSSESCSGASSADVDNDAEARDRRADLVGGYDMAARRRLCTARLRLAGVADSQSAAAGVLLMWIFTP